MKTTTGKIDEPRGTTIFLLFLFFFFVIAAFWTIKPFRTSAVVKEFGIDIYPLLKQGLVIVVPAMVAVYSLLACRLSRKQLVYFFAGLFFSSNILYWYLLTFSPSRASQLIFYFHVDAYVTIMVTIFWTYLNDLYNQADARKIYGYVGTGGLTGGVLGSFVSGWASDFFGTHIILVSAFFMLPIFAVVHMIEKGQASTDTGPSGDSALCGSTGIRKHAATATYKPAATSILEGASTVLKSRYLLCIVVIVGAYEIISTIVDFQFTDAATAAFDSRDSMAGFQGKVFFFGQVISVAVQLVLTTYIHRKFGAVQGLRFLPIAILLGSATFLLIPSLAIIAVTIGSEAALGYSINQSSKEILYVPLDPISKYKGKAFIDMFVLRASKTLGALILLSYLFWLRPLGVESWYLSAVVFMAVTGWLFAVQSVSREVNQRTGYNEK